MLAPSTFALAEILDVTTAKISQLSGYQLLVVGLFGPVLSALAHKWGKRPQYIFASLMGLTGSIICVASGKSYATLLACRLIQGFGTTARKPLYSYNW
ncbi:hypothetical protein VTN00DRAFT_5569 [Thermoascus crustaceus]|uniref:uncharacterized protein n=1 Tax=Thermoascus crustaceus TaxID=5088 RepID=UPI0037432FBE